MEKYIYEMLKNTNSWIVIWFLTSVTKWVFQIRKNDFKVLVFFTDMFFAVIVWYVCWELVTSLDINIIIKTIFVFIMSWNAFVLLSIIFNPDFFKKLFIWIIEKNLDIDLKNKKD